MTNSNQEKKKSNNLKESIRLNRYVANAGICSRREADKLIEAGVISVNNKVITKLGSVICLEDEVRYGKQLLTLKNKIYLVMNKPKGFITTFKDPENRRTVFHLLGNKLKVRVHSIGRLDRDSTGVLLFTNDGDLTTKLLHPKEHCKKIYQVSLNKNLKYEDLKKVEQGLTLEDGFIKLDKISYVGEGYNKKNIGVELHSGKNRIIRRLFEHIGYKVVKLDRVMFAEITKKQLNRGQWRFLTEKEIGFLKMYVGKSKN